MNDYWIKDSLYTKSVSKFVDYPTKSHYTGQSQANYGSSYFTLAYLYRNSNNLCGAKTYLIYMADKATLNTNTAYLNIDSSGANIELKV